MTFSSNRMHDCALSDSRRNVWAHILDGGLFIAALHFISAQSVLPVLFDALLAPTWLIAMAPQLLLIGILVPSIFIAHRVDRWSRVKPFAMWMGFFQRVPFLLAALALLMFDDDHYTLLLWVVASSVLFTGIFGGVILGAWQELVHKTVPTQSRAGMFAARNFISGLLGVFIGLIVKEVLTAYTGMTGFGILFLCASVMVFISYFAFWSIREHEDIEKRNDEQLSFTQNMKNIPRLMKAEPGFFMLCIVGALGSLQFLVIPFMAINIRDTLGADDAIIGQLLTAQMFGVLLGNIIGGIIGNRFGGRIPYLLSFAVMSLCFLILLIFEHQWLLFFAFAILGAGQCIMHIGQSTLALELAPRKYRSTSLSFMHVLMVPFLILSSFLAAWLRETLGAGHQLPLIIALVIMVLAGLLVLRVPEPRRQA